MDHWEKLNETSLSEKEDFYHHINMNDITDVDYAHAKKVCKDFQIKHLGEYHDLHFKVIENFRNLCLKIYDLDPVKFLLALGLAWINSYKKR